LMNACVARSRQLNGNTFSRPHAMPAHEGVTLHVTRACYATPELIH
jgi:hypothetical protein